MKLTWFRSAVLAAIVGLFAIGGGMAAGVLPTPNFAGLKIAGNVMTFPGSAAKVAALDLADQTGTGGMNITSSNLGTISSGTTTIDCGARATQYFTNGGASTIAAPANDGSCLVLMINNGSAGSISFSGFTVGSNTGDALDTTNGHKFMVWIGEVDGVATYFIKDLQ